MNIGSNLNQPVAVLEVALTEAHKQREALKGELVALVNKDRALEQQITGYQRAVSILNEVSQNES